MGIFSWDTVFLCKIVKGKGDGYRHAKKINMDLDWKFFRGDLAPHTNTDGWGGGKGKSFYFGATGMALEDAGWKTIDVPHDFVLEGDYTRKTESFLGSDRIPDMETIDSRHFAGGSLEGGIGWYRKKFNIPGEYEGRRIFLTFDGVFRNSTVYVNEHFVGIHESGYTGFTYDITEYINFGNINLVAVRADASGREGWWYEGGGIYRHVWLTVTEPVYVPENGIYISAEPNLETHQAAVHIETEISNRFEKEAGVCVRSAILNENGQEICTQSDHLEVPIWGETAIKQDVNLSEVILWGPENPYLYTLRTEIIYEGMVVDREESVFGIRDIVIDKDNGFLINGMPLKIKGFCQHMDHAGVGIAVPDKLIEYRLHKIKELGANALRCSHNPPSPVLLDMCDRMGILVMDETRKSSVSVENLVQLRSMVKRDRNHPCIYCWCIGNEEVNLQFTPEAGRVVHAMRMEVRKLDPYRPVTMALVYWNPNDTTGKTDISVEKLIPVAGELDIAGFNYNPDKWDPYHQLTDGQPMMNTEAFSDAWTRSCYETDTDKGCFYLMDPGNENKNIRKWSGDSLYKAENMWRMYNARSYLAGYFIWTAFDYRGEPTPMPYPAISTQFGVMDYCGFKKDIAYFYQSWWSAQKVLHVFPHWNMAGKEGRPVTVYCYSNYDEVEMLVNGKSYGRKRMEKDWFLKWEDIIYEPGTLCAVAYKNGKEVQREEVRTTGAAAKIEMTAYEDVIRADCRDIAVINVRILDENGFMVPTADPQITFRVEGNGGFLGTGNGNPGSHESDKLPVRRAFHGLCQVLVKAGMEEGEIKVTAAAEGIGTSICTIKTRR